ncbi:hypothetical protein BS50DRAFT_626455 [Corynespora cassiicola Philippines]|uniref:Uncharacterized protein n=1 Tax=Corynespora cassiicola Philippines TaxID=1448308 RepID=A0A2T2N3S1_CORCC|nr:hypothetical protein BS50DRAFT_626455 [Corynespora cassiicola Philippines]
MNNENTDPTTGPSWLSLNEIIILVDQLLNERLQPVVQAIDALNADLATNNKLIQDGFKALDIKLEERLLAIASLIKSSNNNKLNVSLPSNDSMTDEPADTSKTVVTDATFGDSHRSWRSSASPKFAEDEQLACATHFKHQDLLSWNHDFLEPRTLRSNDEDYEALVTGLNRLEIGSPASPYGSSIQDNLISSEQEKGESPILFFLHPSLRSLSRFNKSTNRNVTGAQIVVRRSPFSSNSFGSMSYQNIPTDQGISLADDENAVSGTSPHKSLSGEEPLGEPTLTKIIKSENASPDICMEDSDQQNIVFPNHTTASPSKEVAMTDAHEPDSSILNSVLQLRPSTSMDEINIEESLCEYNTAPMNSAMMSPSNTPGSKLDVKLSPSRNHGSALAMPQQLRKNTLLPIAVQPSINSHQSADQKPSLTMVENKSTEKDDPLKMDQFTFTEKYKNFHIAVQSHLVEIIREHPEFPASIISEINTAQYPWQLFMRLRLSANNNELSSKLFAHILELRFTEESQKEPPNTKKYVSKDEEQKMGPEMRRLWDATSDYTKKLAEDENHARLSRNSKAVGSAKRSLGIESGQAATSTKRGRGETDGRVVSLERAGKNEERLRPMKNPSEEAEQTGDISCRRIANTWNHKAAAPEKARQVKPTPEREVARTTQSARPEEEAPSKPRAPVIKLSPEYQELLNLIVQNNCQICPRCPQDEAALPLLFVVRNGEFENVLAFLRKHHKDVKSFLHHCLNTGDKGRLQWQEASFHALRDIYLETRLAIRPSRDTAHGLKNEVRSTSIRHLFMDWTSSIWRQFKQSARAKEPSFCLDRRYYQWKVLVEAVHTRGSAIITESLMNDRTVNENQYTAMCAASIDKVELHRRLKSKADFLAEQR